MNECVKNRHSISSKVADISLQRISLRTHRKSTDHAMRITVASSFFCEQEEENIKTINTNNNGDDLKRNESIGTYHRGGIQNFCRKNIIMLTIVIATFLLAYSLKSESTKRKATPHQDNM